MNCSNCGAANPAGQRFCDECGSALAAACPTCGQPNRAGARFCGNCGATLAVSEVGEAGTPTAAPPGAGTARTDTAERRLVSILFADLVGFTPFSEQRDAEEVRDTLARYFDAARNVIERHGGSVEKFIGDAVMAVWGAPVAREDDAERAVRAALELISAVRGVDEGLQVRAGVLSGEAAVNVGATGQGMLAGDLVNTAARLQSVAAPGTVLVGESTMRAARAALEFEPAGEHVLKGKQAPVPAWRALRVVAERGGRTRSDALEPAFVGRDAELSLLKELVHASSRERRPRLVAIIGPGGIGKSRLAWELEKYVDGVVEDVYWHRGRSPSYGEGVSFWALGEMVRQRAGLAETDDEQTTRARIAATVDEFVPDEDDRRWVVPALLALLGVEPAPAGGRDVLFAAWRTFFERIAARGTTILLFEDLQWADSGMLDFIDHLLEWSKELPIMVLSLARPELMERRPEFGTATRHFHSMPLEPLRESDMRALLAGLVPELPETAVQPILERADGIPLYAVETIRMLIADGRLEPHGRGYRPVGDLGKLAIPDTLRSLVAARLDGLPAADRTLVQDVSVLGQTFTLPGVAAISATEPAELEPRLRALVRREILQLQADPRSPERGQYSFVQSVVREVAYGTLARRDRRRRHLAAARYYESLGDDELAGALASHYLAAHRASAEGEEAEAVGVQARLALRGAAERAISLGALDQAIAYLRQALDVTGEAAERAPLLLRAAEAAGQAGRADEGVDWARQAIEDYESIGDVEASTRTAGVQSGLLIENGRLDEAVALLEATLPHAVDRPQVEAALLARLSRARMRAGDNEAAIATADRALVIAEREELAPVVAEALVNKGSALAFLGRWREGAALLATAAELAQASGETGLHLRALNNLASSLMQDDPLRSTAITQTAMDIARRIGDRSHLLWVTGTFTAMMFGQGRDWDRVLATLDDVLDGPATDADRARLLNMRATMSVMRGTRDPAGEAEALRLSEGATDPGWRAAMDDLEGHVAMAEGDLDRAFGAFMRSYQKFEGNAPYPVDEAFRIALWSGREDRVRETGAILEALPMSGRLSQAVRMWVRAGLAAVDGRPDEALASYRDTFQRLRDLKQDFELACVALDALTVLPSEPSIRTVATEEARPIFERVDARPFLERLDRALATGGSQPTATSQSAAPNPRPAEASPR